MKKTLALLLLLAGLTLDAQAETLTWNGSEGHMTWNTSILNRNWFDGSDNCRFFDGAAVKFGDNGSGVVTLDGELAPNSIFMRSDKDYTFDGDGKLTDTMELQKYGTGTLTINTANDYTGDTDIYEGTLVIGNDHALGTGTINFLGNITLNLGKKNLSNEVILRGETAFIGNGSISRDLYVGNGKTLTLIGDLEGSGKITLSDNATLDLGKNTLSNIVFLSGETASIGNGSISSDLSVGDGKTLTLIGDLEGHRQINLGYNATLNLGNNSLYNDVSLSGSASIGNGRIHDDVSVGNGKTLTLIGDLDGSGKIKLSDNATLDLGGHNLFLRDATQDGETAFIGNGSISCDLYVGYRKTLTLIGDLEGSHQITLSDNATLNLGKHSLKKDVTLNGDASIGNGTIKVVLHVFAGKKLTLLHDTTVTTFVQLAANAALDLGGNTFHQGGAYGNRVDFAGDATIGNGTIEGDLQVAEGKKLSLQQQISITGTVNLAANAALDLGGNVGNRVAFAGDATIGNGTIEGDLNVAANQNLALLHDTTVTGTVNLAANAALDLGGNVFHMGGDVGNQVALAGPAAISNGKIALANDMDTEYALILGDNAVLDLCNFTLSNNVALAGAASIGNGTIVGNLDVAEGKKLTLLHDTTVTGTISLAADAALDLGGNTLQSGVSMNGNATIGNGTINTDLTVAAGKTLTLSGNLAGEGGILLDEGATLNLNNKSLTNTITLIGESANIGNCSFSQGLTVAAAKRINLLNGTDIHGGVTLKDKATLDLGKNTLSTGNAVILEGDAGIGNGTIKCGLTVAAGKTLSLLQNTTLYYNTLNVGVGATVDFGGNSLLNVDFVFAGDATIGNGTLNRDITVESGNKLTLCGAMDGAGIITLKAESTLDLNQYALSNMLSVGDSVTIGNGALNVDVRLGGQMQLNLCGDLGGTGVIHLDNGTTLNLGGHTLTTAVSVLAGNSTTIANGTVKLLADLTGEGTIVFGEDTMVDMNGYTLSRAFSLAGDTTFTNGKVLLTDDVSGEGTFILGEGVTLDTNFRTISNKITLSGSTVTILGGNFDNDLTVGKGQTLIVTGSFMTGKGTLYLGDGATLRQKPTPISSYITNAVMVTGNATIDNGNLSNWVTVAPGVKLTVSGSLNMANSSSIALQDGAILDLGGGSDINARVYVGGDAFVGNGCVNKEILVNSLRKLTLFDSLTCIDIGSQETSTGITLQNNAAVDLGGKTHIIDVRAYGNASIGNGTLDGSVTANHDSSLNFFGETRIKGGTQIPGGTQNPDKTATSGLVTVGNTTIKSLDNANPGLLKELSVSNGLIAGTDRCTSLADGLYIESTAALMIKNMTITANNELHAGYMLSNTVTLNQVTIDLSEANFTLVGSDYYFQVQSLINCTLEMDDVVFDASALELPEDFDPAENGIGFDFGDDVFIGKTEATLLMGDHWSQTVSLGDRGQMVFSALVPMTPEPTTGTLGLLALATLAARRRRK